MKLTETLAGLQAYVLHSDSSILKAISNNKLTVKTRLNIYQQAYYLRMLESLAKTYPALYRLAGEDNFNEWGQGYIDTYPSTHFSIKQFAKFFSQYLNSLAVKTEYINLAAFEWLLEQAGEAADAPVIHFQALAEISPETWEQLQFTLHPSVQIFASYYDIPALWQAVCVDSELPEIKSATVINYWLIWRRDLQNFYCALSTAQYSMIKMIQEDHTFADICEALCEFMAAESVVQFTAENLRKWVDEGIFRSFRCHSSAGWNPEIL